LRRIIDFALRVFSYVFAGCVGAGLLALGLVSKMSGNDLSLESMPWKGEELTNWLIGLGIFGLVASLAAAFTKGPARFLLPIFCLIFAFLAVKGNFLSPAKSFGSVGEFQLTIVFVVGAILAALGSLLQFKKRSSV
jgi:hypothetical protein